MLEHKYSSLSRRIRINNLQDADALGVDVQSIFALAPHRLGGCIPSGSGLRYFLLHDSVVLSPNENLYN